MSRRGKLLSATRDQALEPKMDDGPDVIEEKWRKWISHESYKRQEALQGSHGIADAVVG